MKARRRKARSVSWRREAGSSSSSLAGRIAPNHPSVCQRPSASSGSLSPRSHASSRGQGLTYGQDVQGDACAVGHRAAQHPVVVAGPQEVAVAVILSGFDGGESYRGDELGGGVELNARVSKLLWLRAPHVFDRLFETPHLDLPIVQSM